MGADYKPYRLVARIHNHHQPYSVVASIRNHYQPYIAQLQVYVTITNPIA